MLKIGDYCIIACIVAGTIFSFVKVYAAKLAQNTALTAQVLVEGRIIREIPLPLSEAAQFVQTGRGLTVEVLKDKVRVREAACPDKICMHAGWLSNAGDTAICLPLQTVVKIQSKASEVDLVSY